MASPARNEKPLAESLVEAERRLCGAMILDSLRFREIRAICASSDFGEYRHRVVFECIEEIVEKDAAVDFVGVIAGLEARGRLESFGGKDFVVGLTDDVTGSAHALSHARLVKQASERRQAERETMHALAEIRQGTPLSEIALPSTSIARKPSTNGVLKHAEDPGPFPLDVCDPPGLVGDICRWINETSKRRQPILTLGATLAGMGAFYGRRYASPTDLRTNFYAIGICATGGGKDHARQQLKALFRAAGAKEILGGEDIASGQAVIASLKQHPSRVFFIDEFGHKLALATSPHAQHYHASIITSFLRLYSSAASLFLGTEYANQEDKKNRRVDIEQPNACLYGTTTPKTFYEALSSGDAASGFLNRTALFVAEEVPELHLVASAAPPDDLILAVRDAYQIGSGRSVSRPLADAGLSGPEVRVDPRRVPMTPDADAYLSELGAHIDREIVRAKLPSAELWIRCYENAVRMALIRAIGQDPSNPQITLPDAEWATKIAVWSCRRLEYDCSTRIADNPFERGCKRILAVVTKAGVEGILRSDVARFTKQIETRKRNEMIDHLLEAEQVRAVPVGGTSKGGRKGSRLFAE